MDWTTYEKGIVKLCVWREASGEGPLGQQAVIWVIANRSREWGKSWLQIVIASHPSQFSSMTSLCDAGTIRWPNVGDPTLSAISDFVDEIYSKDNDNDPTRGAIFYWNKKIAHSAWFKKNIVESDDYELSVTIGNHDFYRKKT